MFAIKFTAALNNYIHKYSVQQCLDEHFWFIIERDTFFWKPLTKTEVNFLGDPPIHTPEVYSYLNVSKATIRNVTNYWNVEL